MIGRNRRGYRQASMKARVGIATAVLIGGGAAGVAVAASGSQGPTTASSAGFIMGIRHHIPAQQAMSTALSMWSQSHSRAFSTLAQMMPMRNFTMVRHHGTRLAMQRGVVVLATRQFMVVKSANGTMHVWWLTGRTTFSNVTNNATGMAALTGNNPATFQAVMNHNMMPATVQMAGSMNAVQQAVAPAKPATIATAAGGSFTITITFGTTTVTFTFNAATGQMTMGGGTPTGMPSPSASPSGLPTPSVSPSGLPTPSVTPSGLPTTSAMPTPVTTATMPVTTAAHGIANGDIVSVLGTRGLHGRLVARLVLFSVPPTVTPTTSATPTISATPTLPATPTISATPTVAPTGSTQPTHF